MTESLRPSAFGRGDAEALALAYALVEQDIKPGMWKRIAFGLDSYHAVNLLEALKLVPDTGDWHGSLRISCQMVLDADPTESRPNVPAERQREMLRNSEKDER